MEATRRYSASLLSGSQVRLPGGSVRAKIPPQLRNEYIAEDKLARGYKIGETPYFDGTSMGQIRSWNLTEELARIRVDLRRVTFTVKPNARQESKLFLRFASVDTDELRDLEIRCDGDTAQYKVGEGDCNHYVVANDKKLWES